MNHPAPDTRAGCNSTRRLRKTGLLAAALALAAALPLQAQPAAPATAKSATTSSTISATTAATTSATTAATPAPQRPSRPPSADELALLQAFGQREGLGRLAAQLVDRLHADTRIGHFFKETNLRHLAAQLADQFCVVLNGPCEYDGETMKTAHAELGISRPDFLALVELLQAAMDAQAIPFTVQNQLLARLAPMHREIIAPR